MKSCEFCKQLITTEDFCYVKTNNIDGKVYFHNCCYDEMWDKANKNKEDENEEI